MALFRTIVLYFSVDYAHTSYFYLTKAISVVKRQCGINCIYGLLQRSDGRLIERLIIKRFNL